MLTSIWSIDVQFIFDSVRLALSSAANILQIATCENAAFLTSFPR